MLVVRSKNIIKPFQSSNFEIEIKKTLIISHISPQAPDPAHIKNSSQCCHLCLQGKMLCCSSPPRRKR